MLCWRKLQNKKACLFLLRLTDDNVETSTNFRVGQIIRVFISLLISFLLCVWFYFRDDTLFTTVDPIPQKINIKTGRKIAHIIWMASPSRIILIHSLYQMLPLYYIQLISDLQQGWRWDRLALLPIDAIQNPWGGVYSGFTINWKSRQCYHTMLQWKHLPSCCL